MRATALLVCLLVILTCSIVGADVIFFADDRTPIEGTVTNEDDKVIVTKADGTKVTFAKSEVREVAAGKTLIQLYEERTKLASEGNPNDMFELAMWCKMVGYSEKCSYWLLEILKKDPDNLKVHRYLGHAWRDGRWIVEEDWYSFAETFKDVGPAGTFNTFPAKYFELSSDVSREFSDYTAKYLERFCAALEESLKADIKFRKPTAVPKVKIFRDYESYKKACDAAIEPTRKATGWGGMEEKKDNWQLPQQSVFVHPSEPSIFAYRHNSRTGASFRENLHRLGAYLVYIGWIGGYSSPFKSPRYMIEAFAGYYSTSALVRDSIYTGDYFLASLKAAKESPKVNIKELVNVDPMAYFNEDMSAHSAACWSLAYFMLHADKGVHRAKFFSLIKKDAEDGLKVDAFKAIFKPTDKLEKDWQQYLAALPEAGSRR